MGFDLLLRISAREYAGARAQSCRRSLLCQRFSRLIGYLTSGELIATGITRDGRSAVDVPRAIWERNLTYLDLENGDLLEYLRDGNSDEEYSAPIFMGLMLRRVELPISGFHVKPNSPHPVPPVTTAPDVPAQKKAIAKVENRAAVYSACVGWLAEKMRASPTVRLESAEALWSEAKRRWPSLSERAFQLARAAAIEATGARAWAASGAPKKNKRK